jgi:hypothetical protein
MSVLKAFALWLVILALAIANGVLREKVLIPTLGSTMGLVSSGGLLSAGILLVAWAGAPWYGPLASGQWMLVGAFWLVLTLTFEFGLGRLVQHKTWGEMLAAYTFKGGNIWPVVLLVTFAAPWLVAKIKGR